MWTAPLALLSLGLCAGPNGSPLARRLREARIAALRDDLQVVASIDERAEREYGEPYVMRDVLYAKLRSRADGGDARAARVVFTDCDGTMLQPDHTLGPSASAMLHTLADAGVAVVPSTGRARAGPWVSAVLDAHPVLRGGSPGVYINGASVYTEAGRQIEARHLLPETVERVRGWHRGGAGGVSCGLVAYVDGEAGGEALYEDGPTELYERSGPHPTPTPTPTPTPNPHPHPDCRLGALGDSPVRKVESLPTDGAYKLILIVHDDAAVGEMRARLAPLVDAGAGAELTQALPAYLEVVAA